ncbi:AraC family transcriptional regulator [Cohnella sp. GCM10027633]|uniref:AraC family transcriptional regulator n=1 Tax=unclassified Cohnella TaxID=2636738 RepID=UPI003645DC8C
MIEYLPRSKQHSDLYLTQYGVEECSSGHYFGPALRDHFLLHYIMDGEGIFEVNDNKYRLNKGQGFLICPNVITYYQADKINPWSYCWFGFNGTQASLFLKQAGLTMESPIFCYDKNDWITQYLQSMIQSTAWHKAREMKLTGLLYLMLSLLVEHGPEQLSTRKQYGSEVYVDKVIDFVEMNYAMKITVEDIANFIGLNRSYLCSLFKQRMNESIQEYLIRYRINKACEMMGNVQLTIGDISRSVGYNDPLLFSKIFKKQKGVSPNNYRAHAQI